MTTEANAAPAEADALKVPVASPDESQNATPEAQTAEGETQPSAESAESTGKPPATPEELAQQVKKARSQERYAKLHAESKQYQAEAMTHRAEAQRLKEQLDKLQATPKDNLPIDEQDSHRLKEVVKAERLEQAQDQAQQAAQRAAQARTTSFQAKVEAARDRMPDFDQVFPNTPISEAAADLIADSEKGAEIAYWLGKNPADANRIYSLPPHLQGAEIARIEARLSTVSPRRTSNAPGPTPVLNGGSAPGAKDPQSMSMSEYAEWYAKRQKAKAR